jgi:multidrug efflux pump subunit AcrA (membrane-fusion protein)
MPRQAARASAGALRARLDQMTVRAGISGVVLKRDVEPGDLVTPGKLLLQLGDPASARVTATVDERDIPRIRRGQLALDVERWPARQGGARARDRDHTRAATPASAPFASASALRSRRACPSA